MEKLAHLTDEQFAGYRQRTLAPKELLGVDDHIAACGVCRDRLFRKGAEADLRALRASLTTHLEYDQVAACLAASPSPEVAAHLAECELCRAEVEDLRGFREELNSAPRAPLMMPSPRPKAPVRWHVPAAVAAALLVGAVSVWMLRNGGSSSTNPPGNVAQTKAPSTPAGPPLSAEQNQAVQLALSTRQLERAPILDRLISKPGVLLGSPEPKSFDLQAPLGSAVLTDRPTFQWKPVAGASKYMVSVFDENFQPVAESPAVQTTEWQPSQPLPRNRVFVWQVTATIGNETIHAPTPPAPEARFQIVPAAVEEEIATARRVHPENHLLLAVLCAKAAALDEAARELDLLAATNPQAADDLRVSLRKMRGQ